jgi:hypothetical protein
MKIMVYEWFKLYKKKSIVIMIPLLIFVNGWTYVQQEFEAHRQIIENRAEYAAYEARFQGLPFEQAYELAVENSRRFSGYRRYLLMQRLQDLDITLFLESDPDVLNYGAQFSESEYWDHESLLWLHDEFNNVILEHLEALIEYPNFVLSIEHRAAELMKYSIFNDPGTFTYRNILKTVRDFADVKNLPLSFDLSYGVVSATQYRLTDLLVLASLFILCVMIYYAERDQGQLFLLRSMKYGRAGLYASKMVVLAGLTVFICLLFYGSILLLAGGMYGLGDGSRYIQSIGAFRFSHIPITVREYIWLFIIGKIIIWLMLAALISFLLLVFDHISKSLLVLVLALGASYSAYQFIHPASYWNVLKYLNFFAWLDTSSLLTSYENLNIAGYPVNREYVSVIVMVAAVFFFLWFGYRAFVTRGGFVVRGWGMVNIVIDIVRRRTDVSNRSVSLIWNELKKQIISAKGWMVLLAAFWICMQDIRAEPPPIFHDQYFYNEYMDRLSGPLTDEKREMIEQEHERFQAIEAESERLIRLYREGKITAEQYRQGIYELEAMTTREKAFTKVYDQYQRLVRIKHMKNIDVYMVNEYTANYLFQNEHRDRMNVMLVGLLLTVYLAGSYTIDQRHRLIDLIRTMKYGRRRFFHVVLLTGVGVGTIIAACVYVPQYVRTIQLFPPIPWDSPIQSLEPYMHVDISLTIRQFIIITVFVQWLGMAAICTVMYLLAILLKRVTLTMAAGIVLLVSPTFAVWLGGDELAKFTIYYPFMMYGLLSDQPFGEWVIHVAGIIVVTIGCYLAARNRVENGMNRLFSRMNYGVKDSGIMERGAD